MDLFAQWLQKYTKTQVSQLIKLHPHLNDDSTFNKLSKAENHLIVPALCHLCCMSSPRTAGALRRVRGDE